MPISDENPDFHLPLKSPAPKVLLHGHCHQKAMGVMSSIETTLSLLPDTQVETVETSCCGMAGSFGYGVDTHDISRKMAEADLVPAVAQADDETLIVADGTSCRHQVSDLTDRKPIHVARLLEMCPETIRASPVMAEDTAIQTITRRSLHRELVDRLQLLIISGELVPGAKVPEKDLCAQFGVSRTPLREALKVLASDGLVRLEPNRGAWVTQVTVSEVEEVFPVLGTLEALSGELACQNITDEEIEAVRTLQDQMVQNYENRDLDAYFKVNQEIHKAILKAARNDTLTTACGSLSLRMQRARYLANMSDERWYAAVQEHKKILDCLVARDGKQLGVTLRDHMNAKRDSVVKWLRAEEDAAAT